MRDVRSASPPAVEVSQRARAELEPGEALVFDWTRLAICCAVAGETSLRRTTTREALGAAFVPLRTEDGDAPVFAHRRVYPLLQGHRIRIDCRRLLGLRRFTSSLPRDLGLRASFGRAGGPPLDRRDPQSTGGPQ